MYDTFKKFLISLSESKIIPVSSIFGMCFFFTADKAFKIKGIVLSQISILRFLIENKYISKNIFVDKVKFKDMILYDYIIYTFADKGFSRGTSFSQVEALGKCLGEVFERIPFRAGYSVKTLKGSSLSLKEKKIKFLNLETLAQTTEQQKKERPSLTYDETSEFEWVEVTSFSSKEKVYAPKQLVYWNSYSTKPEPQIREQNTNGLASGPTAKDAVVAALSECLQRHVFFEAWYYPNRNLVVEVDLESISKFHKEIDLIQKEAEVNMLKLRVFRIKSELSGVFEVYFAVLENVFTGGVYVGCSGGDDLYTVIYRSIQETFSIYSFTNRILMGGEGLKDYTTTVTNDFLEGIRGNHRLIWWGHEFDEESVRVYKEFIGKEKELYHPQQLKSDLLLDKVKEIFGDFYYIVSDDDLTKAANHYSARVILPYSYSISLRESNTTAVIRGVYPQNTKAHLFP